MRILRFVNEYEWYFLEIEKEKIHEATRTTFDKKRKKNTSVF